MTNNNVISLEDWKREGAMNETPAECARRTGHTIWEVIGSQIYPVWYEFDDNGDVITHVQGLSVSRTARD